MKKNILFLLSLFVAVASNAQTTVFDNPNSPQKEGYSYRIPAIVTNKEGALVAFADKRGVPHGGDVGYGNAIDIVVRMSTDNGASWQPMIYAVPHTAQSGYGYAHGDAAVVTDRKSGRILMMCASGDVGYHGSKYNNPIRVGRYNSDDNGKTWTGGDVTMSLYDVYGGKVQRLFFSSGRICQSKYVKVGKYYRLYAALTTDKGSIVVYSDDFGGSWKALGGADATPARHGDEAKCEELPNGNVLLSAKVNRVVNGDGGRYFNIYTYSNKKTADGSWGKTITSNAKNGGTHAYNNGTNGEILIVPARRNSDGKAVYVALQSIPFGSKEGNGRFYVGVYYKELGKVSDFDNSEDFALGWSPYKVSNTSSGYSTMIPDRNGDIAFLYEENNITVPHNEGYDLQFVSLPLETITSGKYSYNAKLKNKKFLNN